ncbi:MAG: imidazolonepropionase [Bacteroidota bacterium]
MELLIQNAAELVTVSASGKRVKIGSEMRDLRVIEHGSIFVKEGLIEWVGREADRTIEPAAEATILDASEKVVMPGFVDSHTHLVFAGSRENEFALRAEGKTYQEIAQAGGGIWSTVKEVRRATKKELKRAAEKRLDEMMKHGTTTVEIKSGYGLDMDNEIKMLEVMSDLEKEHYMTVVPTFLGAHAIPPEFGNNSGAYVRFLLDKLIPYVGRKHLAKFSDVFCEQGYFNALQGEHLLNEAKKLGMRPKVHADELSACGGAELAAKVDAISADHLEYVSSTGIDALRESEIVATLLPGVSFSLGYQFAPARKLIDAGVPVALASDFNPGSCMSFSMPMMMTIACTQMKMTPEETITASTLNGAAALGLSDKLGSIEAGKLADFAIYDIPNYRYLPYHFGTNFLRTVIKRGVILEF